ncbi:MAG: DUF3854 domain-containing protein [Acidobacteriales bacterium]|nr:DUF3854 domain-containing protein [Terriglobales bacterium]
MTTATPIPDIVPPTCGGPLTENDYATLSSSSWITRNVADAAMLRRVEAHEGREVVGQKGSRDCAGIVIPYYWPGEPRTFNYRLRRDNPDWKYDGQGNAKPDKKYLGAPGSANRLYIPPGVSAYDLCDLSIPIALVEGEKKALALWRLAWHETEKPRFIPIAIAGVWNWRGTIGKTGGPKGERVDVKGPIADLGRIPWDGRLVFIVFDANVHTNDSVKWARNGIAKELAARSAKAQFVNLPEDCGVNGIDDLLAAWGPERVLKLFEKPIAAPRLQVVRPPQFQSRPDGLFRVTNKGERLVETQLSNYRASIVTNICLDDGVETKREFEVEAELTGCTRRFHIPASGFASLDWTIEQMGPHAITFPNQREYARAAIQSFSVTAEERRIYTHSGWRKVDGHWLFLHAGGAVCDAGVVSDVTVRLLGALSRYELRLSAGPDTLASAVKASLRLVELGSPSISFPLLAATCRAVFGEADFALHLAGETGAFKSEVAALHQQFFGAGMDRLHLPGAWSSTGNALEALAFHAKDALFVIDDFAPQGSGTDVARYHAAADRVFRAAGNHAGRGRLDSTAKLRESKPPRALIVSTGEDIPRGHSVRARLLILELPKGGIKVSDLTKCQRDGREGLYAQAMGGFVQWLAGRYDEARATFDRKVSEYRAAALRNSAHARTPEIVANLQAAFELYLEFCVASEAVDGAGRDHLSNECWEALRAAAAAQAKHQAATEPTSRFLESLRACLSSGRAHLQSRDGTKPDRLPGACGWRSTGIDNFSPFGDCVGWVDGDAIYLEPTAAYRVIQTAGRDVGEQLAVTEQTLKKRLHEKGLLASIDEKRQTLTIRRSIAGSSKDVLHFLRSTILPEAPYDEDDDDR